MAISKIVVDGRTIMDVTQTTVSSDKLLNGNTAVDKKGDLITGSAAVGKNVNLDWAQIKQCVNESVDPSFLPIGTQFVDKWTWQGTTYDAPWNVVHYNKNGIYLQWEYATQEPMAFDEREAIYYVGENGLAAGTYYFSIGYTQYQWSTEKHIQFTLSQACDPGDQFVLNNIGTTNDPTASRTITVYGKGGTTAKQTATTSDGTSGTELGTFGAGGTQQDLYYHTNGNCNGIYWAVYGNHRWSQSAIRQWLNSDAPAGEWWQPQNPWDRPPAYAANRPGFLSGYSEEFKAILEMTRVVTALDTLSGFADVYETTYDKIFLPSAWQLYSKNLVSLYDIEGESWDYWKQKAEDAGIEGMMTDTTAARQVLTIYAIHNHATKSGTWLRSPYPGSSGAYIVTSIGSTGSSDSYNSSRVCPCCIIKKSTPSYLDNLNKLDWTTIKQLSINGGLDIGTQIMDTYTYNNTVYDSPWDVVHYDDEGMYLQMHYATGTVDYDAEEAIYYVGEDGLPAGTYYISCGKNSGGFTTDKHIQFTLTQACDPGDQFAFYPSLSSNYDPTASRTLNVYGFGSQTVKQTAVTSNGTDGVELGSTSSSSGLATNGNVNSYERVTSGHTSWLESNARQWLNSDAPAGQWFTPMNPWDRPNSADLQLAGFLSNCGTELKSMMMINQVHTVRDRYNNDGIIYDTTYDKVFLPSVGQLHSSGLSEEYYGLEGEAFDYYKILAEQAGVMSTLPPRTKVAGNIRKKYYIHNTASGGSWGLRSTSNQGSMNYVNSSGYMESKKPANTTAGCPICKINLIK